MALQVELDSIFNGKGYVCDIIRNNIHLEGIDLYRLIKKKLYFYDNVMTDQEKTWIDKLRKMILIKNFLRNQIKEIIMTKKKKKINKLNAKIILCECIKRFQIDIKDQKQKQFLKDYWNDVIKNCIK